VTSNHPKPEANSAVGVTAVGSGDLLGIKDVKSIMKSGKSKRSPTASSALARRIKPARAESNLTADDLLISNQNPESSVKPVNSKSSQTNLDA
jgi:hypothetical protein